MAGRDVLGVAQTGTGKTAAFGLPILHQLLGLGGRAAPRTCRALVLAPTRELAVQIEAHFRTFAGGARLSTLLVLGGTSRSAQVRALARGVDVVVATPGRLIDLMDERAVRLDETRFVVLDEADRMLDMGFIKPVRRIVGALHPRRQSALFSATMPPEVSRSWPRASSGIRSGSRSRRRRPRSSASSSASSWSRPPTSAPASPRSSPTPEAARSHRLRPHQARRRPGGAEPGRDGIAAEVIHGNKAQNARQRALNAFRDGQVRVLVATDIVARGIDVPGISHVINYDLPDEPEAYVHRIGRTARNGADGIADDALRPRRDRQAARGGEGHPRTPARAVRSRHGTAGPQAGRAARPGAGATRPEPPAAPDTARGLTQGSGGRLRHRLRCRGRFRRSAPPPPPAPAPRSRRSAGWSARPCRPPARAGRR